MLPKAVSICGVFGAAQNMELDVQLLEAAENGQGGWRLYQWSCPAVSLGRFQKAERALLPGFETLVEVVMRPTGGKAVLHGHDLTVGAALPLASVHLEGTRDVIAVYRLLIAPLVAAMRACGAPVALAEETAFMRGSGPVADCFAHVAANDVVHTSTGQKVIGCALKLTDRAVLLQASIPQGQPLVDPRLIFDRPNIAVGTALEAASFESQLELAFATMASA